MLSAFLSSANQILARSHGLQLSTVAWEDTARTKGSCFGPNISDLSLMVPNGPSGPRNAPLLRKPNFADLTSDQLMDSFTVNVGNEVNSPLSAIPLRDYIANISRYTGIRVKTGSLVSARDTHVLTSAQACILPLRDGSVEFGVRLYNYQSRTEPAVLVVIVSAQGTSTHVVLGRDNVLDFNKGGRKASFIAERLRDDRARRGVPLDGAMTAEEKTRNALLIFQIPLVVAAATFAPLDEMSMSMNSVLCAPCAPWGAPMYEAAASAPVAAASAPMFAAASAPMFAAASSQKLRRGDEEEDDDFDCRGGRGARRGMDHGVLRTSDGRDAFPSLAEYTVQRDERFPIRCTIQYYHVTDDPAITAEDMAMIAGEVVRHMPVGSLVVGGRTERPTEAGLFKGL